MPRGFPALSSPWPFDKLQYGHIARNCEPVRHRSPLEVKAYVTLNTLVFDHELFDSPSDMLRAGSGSAIDALRVVSEAKVDALIVQDIGLALASGA